MSLYVISITFAVFGFLLLITLAIVSYVQSISPKLRIKALLERLKPIKNPADVSIPLQLMQASKTGENGLPILIGLYLPQYANVVVFDVSSRADLYGPGQSYSMLTGRDCTRSLAKMNLSTEETPLNDLTTEEWKTLVQWGNKFLKQYPMMGHLAVEDTATARHVAGHDAPLPPQVDLDSLDDKPPFGDPTSKPASSSTATCQAKSQPDADSKESSKVAPNDIQSRVVETNEVEQEEEEAVEVEETKPEEPDFEMETPGSRMVTQNILRSRQHSRR